MYLHACQVRVTEGDSGLCCGVCVTSFKRLINSLMGYNAYSVYFIVLYLVFTLPPHESEVCRRLLFVVKSAVFPASS